jgi:hypothetical protein
VINMLALRSLLPGLTIQYPFLASFAGYIKEIRISVYMRSAGLITQID